MKNPLSNRSLENRIYLMIWFLGFALPVLLSTGGFRIDWDRVGREEVRILPFFIIFLVNNFVLFRYFREKNYPAYFIMATGIILFISFLSTFDFIVLDSWNLRPEPRGKRDLMFLLNTFIYNIVFASLVIGMNNSVKLTFHWLEVRRKAEQLQKENLSNQLLLLQHQISPHFLMNTLNNIHALIDLNGEKAKTAVIKLSKLMRVLLYEQEKYTLASEIGFIGDYIELAKIRVDDNVRITFTFPEPIPAIRIPPLLFVSFVENAFKHGIRAIGKSFIEISFETNAGHLEVTVYNSKGYIVKQDAGNGRIGLDNCKQRLDLVYGNKYTLEVTETSESFRVKIKIPIHDDQMPGR